MKFLLLFLLSVQFAAGGIYGSDSQESIPVSTSKNQNSSTIEISSALLDTSYSGLDHVWCGNDEGKTLLVVTTFGSVHKSFNQGKTWEKLRGTRKRYSGNKNDHEFHVFSMRKSPIDSKIILFLCYGNDWITEDCGENIREITNQKEASQTIKFHPTERKWLLTKLSGKFCKYQPIESCEHYSELHVSKDLGVTWTFLTDGVITYDWGFRDSKFAPNVPRDRVIATLDSSRRFLWRDPEYTDKEIVYSDDYFNTYASILKPGEILAINSNHFITEQLFEDIPQRSAFKRLQIGNPNAKQYDLRLAMFSLNNSKYNLNGEWIPRYSKIVDESQGRIILDLGDLYNSDATGRIFSKSIGSYRLEFEKVLVTESEAVFLVNAIDSQIALEVSKLESIHEIDEHRSALISFNRGGSWQSLLPPKVNSRGERIKCEKEDGCALQLTLGLVDAGWTTTCYKSKSLLGIILGVGKIGKYISRDAKQLNTYLSRDGGYTWSEVLQGTHIYEIGHYGSIVAAASQKDATKELLYTFDQGLTWNSIQISKTPIQVTDILIEPNSTTKNFLVFGYTPNGSLFERQGIVIRVDFATLKNIRTCQNPAHPGSPNSDYELWSPRGALSNCLMGHRKIYIRKKREAQCFDIGQFDRVFSYTDCECTQEDWECDIGYERTRLGSCNITNPDSFELYGPSGYRKVPGSTCVGGVWYNQSAYSNLSKYCYQSNHNHQSDYNDQDDSNLILFVAILAFGVEAVAQCLVCFRRKYRYDYFMKTQ